MNKISEFLTNLFFLTICRWIEETSSINVNYESDSIIFTFIFFFLMENLREKFYEIVKYIKQDRF